MVSTGANWLGYRVSGLEDDEPLIGTWCPVCAAAEFGYRPDVAEKYVCAWEPVASERL